MNIICFTFYLYNGKSLLYYISISLTLFIILFQLFITISLSFSLDLVRSFV